MAWPVPPRGPMRVLGTNLPSTQTVHERAFGGLSPGRPVVIKPNELSKPKTDKSKPTGYRMLWQKTKPPMIERAEQTMDTYMPPGLAPSSLSYVNAKRRRNRER